MNSQPIYPENTVTNPSPFFTSALIEDYNRELDWLWVEGKVSKLEERIYCLRRALYISPRSHTVRRELEKLLRGKSPSRHAQNTIQRWMTIFTGKTAWRPADSSAISDPIN